MRAKGRGQSALLLLDVVDLLSRQNVPYAVIGAFAASFYGIIRASLDVDVIISLTAEDFDVRDLVAALRKDDFACEYCSGSSDDPLDGVVRINDKYGNQVDLITGINGQATRYMPINKALELIKKSKGATVMLTFRREVVMWGKEGG